jgi:hypothetical protein
VGLQKVELSLPIISYGENVDFVREHVADFLIPAAFRDDFIDVP